MNKNIRDTCFNKRLLAVFLLSAGSLLAVSASADVPRFVDPPFIPTGVYCFAIVTADFNDDGIPDVGSVDRYESQIGVTLGNGDGTFQSTQIYNVGQGPSDMKIADLNGDGIPDLVVPLQGVDTPKHEVVVLLGNGNGTFGMPVRFESGSGPSSVALGDLNEDGRIDVVVSNGSGRMQGMSVLLGNGDGTLQLPILYETGDNTNSVVLADFNGDGHLDAAVVNTGSQTLSILLGNGDGTFGTAVSYPTPYSSPFALVVADFNQDSRPDLAVTYDMQSFNVSVFLGNGDGTFQTAIDTVTAFSYPSNLVAGDLNGDSIPDMVTGAGALTILLGKGDGTFETAVGYHTNVGVVTLGQFDGTGGVDALAFESRDVAGFTLISGNADGTFNASRSFPNPPYGVYSAASADLDQDGNPDLVLSGESNGQGQVSVYLNTGDGVLAPRVDYLTGENTKGVAIGDLNNDGIPDLVAANQGDDSVSVLLGTGGGLFQNQVKYSIGGGPWSVVIADFNNDGIADLATINTDSFTVSILLGAGDGSFPTHTELHTGLEFPADVAAGDLDGDGNPDLAVISQILSPPWNVVAVYLGNGDGTFGARTDYGVSVGPMLQYRVKIADVDGDTKPDLVAANSSIDVLLNRGNGTFRRPVTTGDLFLSMGSLQTVDIDGNGSFDLVLGTYNYKNGLFFGSGDGTFSPSDRSFKFGIATALADFNNDGALDVADVQSSVLIRLNTGGSHVALASSDNPSHAGEKVTFHAQVTPTLASAVPSGTVVFLDGDQTLGTATLVDGKARFSTSSLSVGRHRIQASYSGDAIFVPRESKKKTQTVEL
jgi:Bacterial Ig-like domain (group 3)/FG-GAP-like repeat/FG-GAP repeat